MALIGSLDLSSTLPLFTLTLFVAWMVKRWLQVPQNIPPFPVRPFPIVGHIPYTKDPKKAMMEWRKISGDLFSMYLGTTLVIVISSYDLLKETLVKKADYFSDRHPDGVNPVLECPTGITGSTGEAWKENRSLTLNLLRSFGVGKQKMAENIIEEVSVYLDELSKLSGKPLYPRDMASRSASNVICGFLIGKRYQYDDPEYTKLLQLYENLKDHSIATNLLHWFPYLKYVPGDFFSYKKLLNSFNELNAFLGTVIEGAIHKNNQDCNEDTLVAAYLEEMEERKKTGKPTHLSRKNLELLMTDLLIAGTETLTTTLCWFYLYMVHYPKIQEKIYEEIQQVTGGSRLPCLADRAKMNFLYATILEVQRIASISPLGLLHRVREECTVKGYTIPKGAMIIPHLDSVHFDEQIWGDPHTFRPDRFLNEKGGVMQNEHLIAFSLGRRICPGEALARMELFLSSAMTFQRFRITPTDPDHLPPLTGVFGLTYPPVPYQVKFVERR